MILQELSLRDKEWRQIALNITKGDKDLADEITQLMYLKLMKYETFNIYLVAITLKHIYLDTFKGTKAISIEALHYLEDNENTFEPTDAQSELLGKANLLPWHQRELLKESYDRSTRQIAKEYNLNYGLVHREIHTALKTVLGDRYNEYKNSNLKYKK